MKIKIKRFMNPLILVVFLINVFLMGMILKVNGTSSTIDNYVSTEVPQDSISKIATVNQGQYKPEDLNKSTDLMFIQIKGKGYIIKKTTKISEIEQWYAGEHVLITNSLYGGKAYSFYVGNNFESYLYIETIEDGTIFSYGSVAPSYRTNTYSFGDKYPNGENSILYGCLLPDNNTIIGGIYYNKSAYLNGNFTSIVNSYTENFEREYCMANNLSNISEMGTVKDKGTQPKIMLDMSKHATLMFNGIMHYYGKDKNFLETDRDNSGKDTFKTIEEYFYISNQFLEFKSNLPNYAVGMGLGTDYYIATGTSTKVNLSYSNYYVFNPLLLGGMALSQKGSDISEKNIPVWVYNYNKKTLLGSVYSPRLFERNKEVLLTQDEQNKLASGRQYYENAMNKLYKSDKLYKTEPIYNSVTNMYAGELTDDKKEGITDYFNSIRASSGLGIVKADEEGFNVIQHLTTLLQYRREYLGLGISHAPEKPEGLSDSYYKTARGWGLSWGSNISFAMKEPSADNMIYHIKALLMDEGDDKDYTLGHRRDLLKPSFSKFGFGITGYIGAINLSGTQSCPYVCNGLPAVNGITFLENLTERRFKWTVSFDTGKYEVTEATTTEVKCLNTGDTWNFTKEENTDGRIYQNVVIGGNVIESASNKILFYDHDINPVAGYVYQVTIKGLKNKSTGATDSYTYRTVFEYADTKMNPDSFNSVEIEVPEDLKQVESNVYSVEVGKTIKLNAKVDNTAAVDLKLTWTSSNNDAISVTQNGIITINKLTDQDVTIRVSYDGDNSVMDQIIIRPKKGVDYIKGDINQDKTVNINDVNYGIRGIVNKIKLTDLEKKIGDVNNDETFNINDINTIMRFVVGKVKGF